MIELSKKVLLVLMVIPVLVVIFAIAYWQNWGGIGSALAGFGGPVGSGLLAIMQNPFKFALQGGPQTALVYGLGAAIIFGFAYWVWHWDIGYKLTGAVKDTPASTYSNDMKREPDEPERAPATQTGITEKL